ncbi:FAD-binding oxidoreductase [Aspergillus fischeri NRRL 181]|uniref:FAD binding domain protein n=1 Tax=Neosartorya fischeri (strain ATCC 1020 / DSM 3700 / CBS 544.65 / FGSC A1164 / JCM 1740 / NRRL 181 / WB 181) TaxID=331117 RepID=A1DAL2_NEOFI|nr:FAD binding domain protein [Aspergillus fischeri NRRL 181]EAW19902.1 FAD binding domain protein [Aspergillus fischeri NRRL 181]
MAFQQLRAQLDVHATVVFPGDQDWDDSVKRWSAIGFRRPGVVVLPTDVQGIARTVRYAKDHKLDLAVQGGGHSSNTASSTDGGILLNLGKMNRVSVDTSTQTVTVQGGATWADVARETAKYQLAVNGGTTSQVGVGGLTLRGGFGFLTPQHGVTLDTLLAAKVVTAEGIELQVSTEEHPDLFWAIRGAGPNVAVVAEFTFQAYPQPNLVWSGLRIHPSSEVSKVVEALNQALVHPQGRAAAQCILCLSPEDERTPSVTTIIFFNGSEEEGRRHFAQLLEVECIKDDIKMRPYSETLGIWDRLAPPGDRKRELGIQMTLPPRLAFLSELMDKISDKLTKEPDLAKTDLEIDYLDPTQICRTPITETAFPTRLNSLLHATLMLQWTDADKDEDFLSWGQSIQKMCENELTSQGHKLAHTVSNYNGYTQEIKVAAADMFGVNAERLLHVKAKYDPANIFNKLNPLDRNL